MPRSMNFKKKKNKNKQLTTIYKAAQINVKQHIADSLSLTI